tara:strand:- start:13185 stop:14471 length:1287 start_codon:yes stop_codon:yes gene_type:complete
MKVVIQAGGQGTRLGKKTMSVPKPMVKIIGKPILWYQLEWCNRYDIDEVFIIINHLGEVIKEFVEQNKNKFKFKIRLYNEILPLGTVGGIKALEANLRTDFLVLYGDVLFDIDLERLLFFHINKKSETTLVIHPNDHPHDSDLVELDESQKIIAFHSKPHDSNKYYHNIVNAALYVFSTKIFNYLPKDIKSDFGKDIFPYIVNKLQMYGYITTEYLKDMGTPKRLELVSNDIKSGKVFSKNLRNLQKAIFLDRDGVINIDTPFIHSEEQFNMFPFVPEAICKINRSEYLVIVVTNQSVIARNLTDINGLNKIHKKMEHLLGKEGAYLDAIYYCPHHPDSGYPEENIEYKIDCECRKPKSGMFLSASKRFNIDLENSYIIGDSGRDIIAGKNVGCTTILVDTGNEVYDCEIEPDYKFSNLLQAVNFIFK